MEVVTCKAPVNIAAIKYCFLVEVSSTYLLLYYIKTGGKRDEKLILPLNDSISVTLSTKMMYAKTTVALSPNFKDDQIWLNGRAESISNPRLVNCLSEIREIARNNGNPKINSMLNWKIHIVSENNFPTAAGLASSAAGYACLVYALAQLFRIEGDLSSIARRGSGSACRSIYGGFVIWKMGKEKTGSDSVAKQIAPASHWKEMKAIILVVRSESKAVGSSVAMQRSVATSDFLKNVSGPALDERVKELTKAILNKDFETFARITMKDSNRLHSVCLDTYPPVQYLNDTSHYIIQLVHSINDHFGKAKVAYSFDAGPNACLFLLKEDVPLILSIINYIFPPNEGENGENYFRGEKVDVISPPSEILLGIPLTSRPVGSLKGIIYLDVGEGPEVLGQDDCLINDNGLPKNLR